MTSEREATAQPVGKIVGDTERLRSLVENIRSTVALGYQTGVYAYAGEDMGAYLAESTRNCDEILSMLAAPAPAVGEPCRRHDCTRVKAEMQAEVDRLRAVGVGEAVATLHSDGYWTHGPGKDPFDRFGPNRNASAMPVYDRPAPEGGGAENALRDALDYVGYRNDGDLNTLAERAQLWMRESKVLIDELIKQRDTYKERAAIAAQAAAAVPQQPSAEGC